MHAIPAWHSAAERVLPVAAGSIYGLALARFLFELDPARWTLFNTWLGALALAALCAALALILSTRYPRLRPATVALALPLLSLLAPDVNLLRAQTLLLGALALFLLLNLESWNLNLDPWPLNLFLWDLSLGLLLFALYLRTLAPAVGQADTFEFQVGIARLGIAHGSGYPLLMLVGKLFTLLPVGGTLAFRANLTSAFFGALAAVGAARLARRLGVSPLIAGIAGLAFGVSPTLWSRAVEVEAYTLNAALVVALLNLLVQSLAVSGQPSAISHQPTASSYQPWALYLTPFLFGLSLTNHLTTLLLAPACLAAVSLQRSVVSRQPIRHWSRVAVILSFLVGFSIYLYLPLRWPAVNHGEMLSWAQFINILTGNEAKGAFQWTLPFTEVGRYAIVGRKLAAEYGWAGIALTLLGAWKLAVSRQPSVVSPHWSLVIRHSSLIILATAYLGYLYFALAFNVPDPDFSAFLIPLHLIAAVLMGIGVQAILNSQGTRLKAQGGPLAPYALRLVPYALSLGPCAFALLPLSSIYAILPRVDHSGEWADDRAGRYMLSQPLAQNAAILADSKKIAPLYYLQVAEGVRPDLDIIVLPDEASYRAVLDERLASGQTVYLGRYLPGLGGGYFLRSVGPLAEVSATPFQAESTKIPFRLSAALAEGIRLIGYAAETETRAAASFPITLFWQAPAPPPQKHWLVYLRLVDATGAVAWQSAGRVPVSDLYPTNAWRAGEVVPDYYSVPMAETLAPGAYRLQAGLFPPFAPDETGWAEVLPLTVLPAQQPPRIAHPVRMRLGAEWLMGYDAPETAAPGSRQKITYLWQNDAGLRLTESTLTMPTSGDSFSLTAQPSVGARAQCGWLAPPTDECALALIRLTGAAIAEGAINFDNQLLLRRVALDTPQAVPGGGVEVTLEWQGLQAMAEDYTVFVHLIGPDGVVHGQVDAWPVSGTRATSTWAPGDIISDHYRIAVPNDAPPGAYQIEVGLYLLATFERLPVLNAEGAPVDDRVLKEGLRVGR